MIATGIVRRADDLGRLIVPKDVRKQVFGTADITNMPFEVFYERDGTIIFKPLKDNKI